MCTQIETEVGEPYSADMRIVRVPGPQKSTPKVKTSKPKIMSKEEEKRIFNSQVLVDWRGEGGLRLAEDRATFSKKVEERGARPQSELVKCENQLALVSNHSQSWRQKLQVFKPNNADNGRLEVQLERWESDSEVGDLLN